MKKGPFILVALLTLPTVALAQESTREFRIESIRIVVLPTKEDGRCWDPCNAQIQAESQQATMQLEDQSDSVIEAGTQEAEAASNYKVPSPDEINAWIDTAQRIIRIVATGTFPPEVILTIRGTFGEQISYHRFEQDRATATFSNQAQIQLRSDPANRYILVDVYDKDLAADDRIGFRRINIGDGPFNNGGPIVVRFDRVHMLEIMLRPLTN